MHRFVPTVAAMCVCNPDRSPARIDSAEIFDDDFPILHSCHYSRLRCSGQRDRNARACGRFQRAEALLVTTRHEFEAELGVDKFGCAWTLCSTRFGYGCPQRSQLQPGVPSLARCVTLLPATFWNLGLGDLLSSCNKRIVFISYSFFAWQIRIRRDRKTSRGLAFALRKSLRPKPTAII